MQPPRVKVELRRGPYMDRHARMSRRPCGRAKKQATRTKRNRASRQTQVGIATGPDASEAASEQYDRAAFGVAMTLRRTSQDGEDVQVQRRKGAGACTRYKTQPEGSTATILQDFSLMWQGVCRPRGAAGSSRNGTRYAADPGAGTCANGNAASSTASAGAQQVMPVTALEGLRADVCQQR